MAIVFAERKKGEG